MELQYSLDGIASVAIELLKVAGDRRIFAFYGEMGAGKTTLIHSICEALDVEDVISSPTYPIINQYNRTTGQAVYHIDLYRLKDENEVVQAGVEECLFSGEYCFIEWPGKASGILPPGVVEIHIYTIGVNDRKLEIN